MTIKGFFLFPGQGAQEIGMARDACETGGHAHALFEEASEALGFDLQKMVFEGDAETLARTENCQPALVVASIALLETLREQCDGKVEITGAAGLSLGEYTALVALESLDFADAVRLVRRRGELMAAAGGDRETGMSSVIGLDAEVIEKICAEASDAGVVQPANYNSPGQIVISGDKVALDKAGELLKQAGAKRVLPLKVSAAFHSPVMEPARQALAEALADIQIREPNGKFYNNADARALTDPEAIRDSLARQLVSPVRWEQSCLAAIASGEGEFFEVGPGAVCAGLMKRIDRSVDVHNIRNLTDMAALTTA